MVSLAFFAIEYSFLSLLLILLWRGWRSIAQANVEAPNVLFWLRVLPFVVSAATAVFLTFPSFLLLEAHSMDEDLGTFVLCLCSLLFLGGGLFRVIAAQARTRRAEAEWLETANRAEGGESVPATSYPNPLPIMLAGIRTPRLLVSEAARALLTVGELQAAVRHEVAHLRSCDNLKKAIFNFISFPGMASLERAWQEAAELDADLRAVSNRAEALDLASALVKLSRGCPPVAPALATGLVGVAESVAMRVERLLEWERSPRLIQHWRYVIPLTFVAMVSLAANLGPALVVTHSLTERLVP
jgi:beta-lactamase regulating signal transducer with metallopeptidase domain